MRGIVGLLLIGFIGLVAVGVWNARQSLPPWGVEAVSSGNDASTASSDANRVAGEVAAKASKNTRRTPGKGGLNSGAEIAMASIGDFPVSETVVYVPTPGFPTRKDFRIGAKGSEIRSQYGEPTARVTEMRDGRVFEHYYYFNPDRTQLTMATLENGLVISAESTSP